MKTADASSSLAPCALLNVLEDKIQISNGILQIRISVMELGRFTARPKKLRQTTGDSLIMRQGEGEGNGFGVNVSGFQRCRVSTRNLPGFNAVEGFKVSKLPWKDVVVFETLKPGFRPHFVAGAVDPAFG